jgi:hypothetical protein
LTVEQVAKRFFPAGEEVKDKEQAGYRRVLTLQKFRMVKLSPILTGAKVVQVTSTGAGELDSRGQERLGTLSEVDYRYYEHDRRVTDVRIVLEKLGLVEAWQSERQLKKIYRQSARVPDAVFKLKNGQRVALEVEIANKGPSRYQTIFEEYARKNFGELDLVFYVCNTLPQLESLAKFAKAYNWFYFALYGDLMEKGADTIFANHSEHFKLRELL